MKLEPTQETTATVVSVPVRNLDADTSGEFRASMSEIVDQSRKLVMNLEVLEFIDSSGLGAILACLRDITANGGDMKICGLSDPVRAAFDLVRMHRILDIHDDLAQALASFER